MVSQGISPDFPGEGQVWLNFDGINYREHLAEREANRGHQAGRRRLPHYTFNVTSAIRPREANVLAVEVFRPT